MGSKCLDVGELRGVARSGAPVRFTREFKGATKEWLGPEAAGCEHITIEHVERVERTYEHHRFVSMDNPEELEFSRVVFFRIHYRIPGEGMARLLEVTENGHLSNRVSERNGPPVFLRGRRGRTESTEQTFLLICPCGRAGEIGRRFQCCGGEMLRLSGTRRSLEKYLESMDKS